VVARAESGCVHLEPPGARTVPAVGRVGIARARTFIVAMFEQDMRHRR